MARLWRPRPGAASSTAKLRDSMAIFIGVPREERRPARHGPTGRSKSAGRHRGAAEEHLELHAIAVGQCEFNMIIEIQQNEPRDDHEAKLAMAAGVRDLTLVQHLGLAVNRASRLLR